VNRIDSAFATNKASGKKGFIPYFTAGFPTPEESFDLILAAAAAGSTVIEIGAPFSDPIADGPVIQHSSQIALQNGVNLGSILEMTSRLREKTDRPLVLMGYANNFLQFGYRRFVKEAVAAGIDGVIVPDLPPEEATELLDEARERGLAVIFLVAQTSREERVAKICEAAGGFIYYVARLGVTGAGGDLSPLLAGKVRMIKNYTDLPVAAGFGISTPRQAAAVMACADAAIMGSALIKMVMDHSGPGSAAVKIERFITQCIEAQNR